MSSTTPSFARRFAALAAALVVALSTVALSAAPAAAATPKCQTFNGYAYVVGNVHYLALLPVASSTSCYLNYGTWNNEGVEVLQTTLNKCYGESLVRDGDYGYGTRAAVQRTQSKVGVGVDGVYGPNTRSAMRWWVPSLGSCKPYSSLS